MNVYWCNECKTPVLLDESLENSKSETNNYLDIEDEIKLENDYDIIEGENPIQIMKEISAQYIKGLINRTAPWCI